MSLVVALTGSAGVGKSTVAEYLVGRYGFQRIRFSDPLKHMLAALLSRQGCTPEYVRRCLEGDLKSRAVPELGGRTPRHALQTLGTEWGRTLIDADFWLSCWRRTVEPALRRGPVVADDCRFTNELDAVKAMGGLVWRVAREGCRPASDIAETEHLGFEVDCNLVNNGAVTALLLKVDQQLRAYQRAARRAPASATAAASR